MEDWQAAYKRLQRVAEAAEVSTGAYLFDECVDRENVLVDGMTDRHPQFWKLMYHAARQAFADRCEENGWKASDWIN